VRIAILFDDVGSRAHATDDERGVLDAVTAVDAALGELGHERVPVPIDHPRDRWIDALRRARADLAFNLCEGAGGSSAAEPHIAAFVELLGVPLTGSSAETLAFARRKDRVNAMLAAGGVPVPAWRVVREGGALRTWTHYPAIVKPAAEDASVGITQRSVARNATELGAAIHAARAHGPLLVQTYLEGRELNVGVLGDEVLPISEIDFGTMPASHWRLVTYSAKWEAGSAEDLGTVPRCPAEIDEALATRARCLALDAWRAVDGRGYGRVDLRADATDTLYVLEVNPNPDLAPSAGLARMAAAAGYDYTTLIDRIVREATR
jgi:D-alanine-D-alanine ligase